MKMIETLTTQQKVDMLNGASVGIFPSMILPDDIFFDRVGDICLGYYTARSGEKTISPAYEKYLELISQDLGVQSTAETIIGRLIRSKFLDKWNRVYEVLLSEQYNALENQYYKEHKGGENKDEKVYDTEVKKDGNNSDLTTYNTTLKKDGSNADTTTYDTSVEDDGNTGTEEITTRESKNKSDVYGFNSLNPVGDSEDTEDATETVSGSADKNTSHNLQTKTGTENKEFTIDETQAKSGTENKDLVIDETERKTGTDTTNYTISEDYTKNGRDIAGAELVNMELNLRNEQIFFDIIYADIDSIATLQIYI